MNHLQAYSFGILGLTMGLFMWGRLRYDLVAVLALLASIACGTVSPKKLFRASAMTSSSSLQVRLW
jgi:di/tricarboxylate transporter